MKRKRTLLESTEATIIEHDLFTKNTRIVVAVSGGPDSIVLLDILHRLSEKYAWEITVAHLNHMLRGSASDEDEEFVRKAADRLKLNCEVVKTDIAVLARSMRISIEMAGRCARQLFLDEVAGTLEARSVAMAHHADDQVETFWLNLLRGELGVGLGGMTWKRPMILEEGAELVRPFLHTWKSEILEYAHAKKLEYRQDATNFETKFQRNELRLEVLPALEKFQPRLRQISLRTAEMTADEKNFISEQASEWRRKRKTRFEQLHPAVQREVMHIELRLMRIEPTFDLIEKLRTTPEEPIMVSAKRRIFRETSGKLSELHGISLEYRSRQKELSLAEPGHDGLGEVAVEWDLPPKRGSPARLTEYFDADAVGSTVLLRYWQPGDRYQQCGSAAASKLQDIFTNAKVPLHERRERVLAVAQNGELFWVEGLRIGEKFKVRSNTRRVLKWSWRREPASPT